MLSGRLSLCRCDDLQTTEQFVGDTNLILKVSVISPCSALPAAM